MALKPLMLVIGGAVASTVGTAFKTVESGIQKLEAKGNKAKVLKSTIGETIKLREEWKRAHDSGAAGADKLLRKLNGNLEALRNQGVEVSRLSREYQRLGREARAADLQVKGHQQMQAGKESLKSNVGKAVAATAAIAVPTTISANYQAIIRDIAIKADIANKPQEQQLTRTVIDTAADTGMARNGVAELVNRLVGAGMDLDKALSYAPVAAKFAIGQGASGGDTASMIQALEQNAKISDPKVMQQALEAIAYQGQAGSFEASDMARWFPQLLANMEKSGITGIDAVTSLGSMLQVQMKTAGSSDEAANNLKNWIEKIGAGDVVKAYKDAGIDYQASLNTGLQKGMNVIEASMALAMKYVETTDPAQAKKIKDAQAKIDKEVDPEKARAALEALEKTLRTGDIFADMQVKAALTAYGQNRGLYEELKADSKKASGILDKNLAERRETSAQQWAETVQAADDAMRSIGDAIRPATDMAAKGLTAVAQGITTLSDKFPAVVTGIAGTVAALLALGSVASAYRIGKGAFNFARGAVMGRGGKEDEAPTRRRRTGNKVVDAGLGVLDKVLSPRSSDAEPANDPLGGIKDPQRVFVVNADAFGKIGSTVANSGPAGPARGSRRSRLWERRRAAKQGAAGRPVAAVEAPRPRALPAAATALNDAGELGKVARSMRGMTRLARRLPGGNFMDAGTAVLDVALNAKTQDEKAEGYGAAGGSLAGTLAGAAAGAAIGSVVPMIGTAVGGAVGAVLGGMGGESVGAWLGKRWFGEEAAEGEAKPETPAAPGEALRVTLEPQEAKPATPAVLDPGKPAPVVVDNRDPVAAPLPAPAVPVLGDAVRGQAKPVAPAAPVVVPPAAAPAVRVTAPEATPTASVVVDNRDPVAVPSPAPAAPVLGDAVRGQAKPVAPAAPVVVPPAAAPAVRVTAPKATPAAPVVVDNRDPVAVPSPAPAAPVLGDAVRGQAKPVAPAAPVVLPPAAAPAVRVTAPKATPTAPVVVDSRDPAAAPLPAPAAPALGDAVRGQAKPVAPAAAPVVVPPATAPAIRVTAPKATPAAPVVVDNRDPGAVPSPAPPAPALGDAVRSQPKPSMPAPAPLLVKPVVMPAPREPLAKAAPMAPLVLVAPAPKVAQGVPAQTAPQPAPRLDGLGDVVRDMAAKAKAPAPRLPEPAKPAKATPVKPPAPKVNQSFTFSPSIKVDVHGDVKEPDQVVREIEAPLRRLFEDWKREAEARMATVQLYDQPHV
ncbi:phage tail tape measure protein [Pseudomonas monteilii]|uniref:phage tail tape measure protein n=1 Tax=Pseudomonas monteilii TaxID=76759 RepID=UPI0036EBCC70